MEKHTFNCRSKRLALDASPLALADANALLYISWRPSSKDRIFPVDAVGACFGGSCESCSISSVISLSSAYETKSFTAIIAHHIDLQGVRRHRHQKVRHHLSVDQYLEEVYLHHYEML